jgi:hypothetical protein
VLIEVVLELPEQDVVSVFLSSTVQELQEQLMAHESSGIADLRAWLIARARTRFELASPHRARDLGREHKIYWICGHCRTRAPFLR